MNLGIDASKSDQQVRGSTVMPHGIGKSVRVAVFTGGKNADAAREAGADIVGLEDLAAKVKAGELNFDVVIASPDAMRVVGQLGQILGPRGLMPNPKVGTVTPDVAGAVKNAKAGQVRYRVDKGWNRSLPDRQGELRAAETEGEPGCAAARPAEAQAFDLEGRVSQEAHRVLDDGARCVCRSGEFESVRRLMESRCREAPVPSKTAGGFNGPLMSDNLRRWCYPNQCSLVKVTIHKGGRTWKSVRWW